MSHILTLFYFFCVALGAALLPVFAVAAPGYSSAPKELCLLPELDKSLSQYQQLADQGGWPQVPIGPTLRENDHSERVPILKKRLIVSGDLTESTNLSEYFDETLKEGVQKFQARHGLTTDGIVGRKTLAALNVPISERIRQLSASLRLCQPLPQVLERRHILVNIADFTLKLFENGELLLSMPVIVGKTYRQTPVFSGLISTLVLNPTWKAPHSIATQDLLPKIKEDLGFLDKMHLRVFKTWTSTTEIDPATIDWDNLSLNYFPYRLRQDAGPVNVLGRVKFLFPNPHDVYLHDTPARELFHKDSRTYSSGCIRVAKPLELALYLLQDTSLETMDALKSAIATEKTQRIVIPSPIPIHMAYMTTWVDNEGIVQFRPDIYNRNPAM